MVLGTGVYREGSLSFTSVRNNQIIADGNVVIDGTPFSTFMTISNTGNNSTTTFINIIFKNFSSFDTATVAIYDVPEFIRCTFINSLTLYWRSIQITASETNYKNNVS